MTGLHASLRWKYAIREVRRRPLRSLLTLVGIVLGVAAVTAVALGTEATRDGYAGMFQSVAGRADLEVLPPAGLGVMPADLAAFDVIPGVGTAVPIVQAPASLVSRGQPVPLLVLGVDPARDHAARDRTLVAGEDLTQADGLLLEAGFAARYGLAPGDHARLMTARGPAELPVVGLLAPAGPALFNGGAIAFLPLQKAQSLFTSPGQVSAVQLVLEPGASLDLVRQAALKRFPQRQVQRPGRGSQLASEFLGPIDQA